MSDIRATLRQKFEARNPPAGFMVFAGDRYVHGYDGINNDYMVFKEDEDILAEYNKLWAESQATYADAVRDCANACKKILKDGDGMTIGVGVCIDAIEELAP